MVKTLLIPAAIVLMTFAGFSSQASAQSDSPFKIVIGNGQTNDGSGTQYYYDENGNRYYYDRNGNRHYDNGNTYNDDRNRNTNYYENDQSCGRHDNGKHKGWNKKKHKKHKKDRDWDDD